MKKNAKKKIKEKKNGHLLFFKMESVCFPANFDGIGNL